MHHAFASTTALGTHPGFCEPITKNEKIENESALNGIRPGRVSRLHGGPDSAGKPRVGSAPGNVPGVA